MSSDERPDFKTVASCSREAKTYWGQWSSLMLSGGIVYRKFLGVTGEVKFYQLLIPRSMRNKQLQIIHEKLTGHLNARKTQEQVKRRAYWVGWRKDVDIFCRCCKPCSEYFRGTTPRHGTLQDMRVGSPMERLQLDLTGPHPRSKDDGMTYICTCVCAFTKYAVAIPIPDKSAITVARAVVEKCHIKAWVPRCDIS